MITKISSFNACTAVKDPRRKAQSIQLKKDSGITYKSSGNEQYAKQKSNALTTSLSIVAGSILFTVGYFMISALTMNLKK